MQHFENEQYILSGDSKTKSLTFFDKNNNKEFSKLNNSSQPHDCCVKDLFTWFSCHCFQCLKDSGHIDNMCSNSFCFERKKIKGFCMSGLCDNCIKIKLKNIKEDHDYNLKILRYCKIFEKNPKNYETNENVLF